MAKNQVEKQNLPGEVRLFDTLRDVKEGKNIVLISGAVSFPSEETYIEANDESGWMQNIIPITINQQDSIIIDEIEGEHIIFTHSPVDKNKLSNTYKIPSKIFIEAFQDKEIAIVKKRKVKNQVEKVKNNVEQIVRPSIEKYKEGSIYKVIKEGYLLPERTKNNKYKKVSFLLEEGDILKVNKVEDFFGRSMKSKNEKLFITILRKGKEGKVENIDIIITSQDFINYAKGGLKPLKDTQKVQEKVDLLLDSSNIIPTALFGVENS